MITSASKKQRFWVALAILGAFAAASCGQDKHEHQETQEVKIETPPEFDRGLNQTELDSMRAMKITHRVTRDDYWDMKGGVIANDRVEVWYSSRKIYVLQAIAVLKQMDQVATRINKSFGRLPEKKLVVVCAPDMDSFRAATGRDWWHYAQIKSDTLSLQTPMTLFMRGLLHYASQQEYSRWALDLFATDKAPEWVVWGMAAHLADERDLLRGQRKEYATLELRMDPKDVDKQLANENDRLEFRRALFNAYLMMNQLIETHGMPSVAAFILAIGESGDVDAAAQAAFSKSYQEVLGEALAWKEPAI